MRLIGSVLDPMVVQPLARERCHPTSTLHAPTNWRGGNNNNTLPVCFGHIPRLVHSQLDIPLLYGRVR